MEKNILLATVITYVFSMATLQGLSCPENNQPIPFAHLTPKEVSFYRNACHYVVDFDTNNLVHSSQYKVEAIS